MSADDDQIYFAERERQCLKRAQETADPDARLVHLQLALHYGRRARPAFGDEPLPPSSAD
jgi:hypothetical protein